MSDDGRYSVEGARKAAESDALDRWVADFLASVGSDNPLLGQKLTEELGWWAGPVLLPLHRLKRLAGPPGEPVLVEEEEERWDERVEVMEDMAEDGWKPPPVIVSYRHGELELEDGNHRVESLRRAGQREGWSVVGFEREQDRDRFASEWADSP